MQEVEDDQTDRIGGGGLPDDGTRGGMHPVLESGERRPAVSAEHHQLAVEQGLVGSERLAERPQLGKRSGDVLVVPAHCPWSAAVDPDQYAHPVPFELIGPLTIVRWELTRRGQHRSHMGRERLEPVGGRIHPVDHPVVTLGGEEDITTLGPFAVQHHLDFVRPPLLAVVVAAVPNRHLAGAVFTRGDGAAELPVLQRMVFDLYGQVVLMGRDRKSLGQRPRGQHAVALQAEVPVQAGGVMLLDDEDRPLSLLRLVGRGGVVVGDGLGRVARSSLHPITGQ